MENEFGLKELSELVDINDFKKVISILDKGKGTLIQFIGALSLLAYQQKNYNDEQKLKEILKRKYLSNLYTSLEEIHLFPKKIFSISEKDINRILKLELSDEAISYVAYLGKTNIESPTRYWGVIYLFCFLLELDLMNFEKWIQKTKNIDFKIIFLNILSYYIYNENIELKNLDHAHIGLIQAFYAICSYGLEPNSANVWSRQAEDISNILNCNLSEKNKFYIYLRFIFQEFRISSISTLEKDRVLKKRIKEILSIKYKFLKEDLIIENCYSWPLAFLILKCSKRNDKTDFFTFLAEKIMYFFNTQNLLDSFIPYSFLLGMIMCEIDSISIVEKKFNSLYKRLSFPYTFCKNKKWEKEMTSLFYLLLSIIYYKKKKKEPCDEYIKRFSELRSYGHFFIYEKIDNTLKKILNSSEKRFYKPT